MVSESADSVSAFALAIRGLTKCVMFISMYASFLFFSFFFLLLSSSEISESACLCEPFRL